MPIGVGGRRICVGWYMGFILSIRAFSLRKTRRLLTVSYTAPVGCTVASQFRGLGARIGNDQLVQGCQVSFGAGDNNVGVGPMTAKGARLVVSCWASSLWLPSCSPLDAHGHLAKGVDPLCDGMHGELQQGVRGL